MLAGRLPSDSAKRGERVTVLLRTGHMLKVSQRVRRGRLRARRRATRVRDGQFVVQAGSLARVKEIDSIGAWTRALRKTLRNSGVLVPADDAKLLRFTQEYAFDSPSGAAAVVAGSNVNGRLLWKVKGAGISYKDWQQKQVHGDVSAGSTRSWGRSDGDFKPRACEADLTYATRRKTCFSCHARAAALGRLLAFAGISSSCLPSNG